MKTIQIEVSDNQFDALKNLSEERGKSISELLNIAVGQLLFTQKGINVGKILSDIKMAAGIWSDRSDIGKTEEYVRSLRKGTAERMKRLGIWNNDEPD